MTQTHVQRNYKDTMFRMLFKEKENLLSLYNAVNKTSYMDVADFLSKNRAEAIAVSIFEYDEEKHLKNERELAYKNGEEAGLEKGRMDGKIEGETLKLITQICKKIEKGQGPEEIAEDLEEEIETILPIYELSMASAPEYDREKIYKELI